MKSRVKKGLYLFSFFILASLMASCLGNSNAEDTYSITDAELLSFNLSNNSDNYDSIPGLANVVFTIDQQEPVGQIYNYDSLPYLTTVDAKVLVTYVSGSGMDNVLNITDGDSTWVKSSGDSIDISKPLTFRVYAIDGQTKLYNVQLNIHQIDPDSVQYRQVASELSFLQTDETKTVVLNDQFLTYSKLPSSSSGMDSVIVLYQSSDAMAWMPDAAVSGLPVHAVVREIQSAGDRLFVYTDDGELYVRSDPAVDQWVLINKPEAVKVKSVLGYLNSDPKHPEGLSLIVETAGVNTFAFVSNNLTQWEYDSISPTPVPDDFPVRGFSSYNYQVMYTSRVSIFGGISLDGIVQNAVWSTENGRYWAKLTGDANVFPLLEGANVFYYNDGFWLINGKLADGYNNEVYYSPDGGVTWSVLAGKCQTPEEYPLRYNASLVMDKENKHFYIIGGRRAFVYPDVWKGLLNKMEFDH